MFSTVRLNVFSKIGLFKKWRAEEAKKRGIPPFLILTDRTIEALCIQQPKNKIDLYNIPGLGEKLISKYGTELIHILGQ